jgi:hypothetical protein
MLAGTAGAMIAQRSIGGEKTSAPASGKSVMGAYGMTAPMQYGLNEQYQPQWNALGQQNMEQLLFGGQVPTTKSVPIYNKQGRVVGWRQETSTETAPGLIGMAGQANQQYGEQAKALWRMLYPEQAALQGQISGDASSQLALGGTMDPRMTRQVQQATRQGQAARGLGYGPSDVFLEALNTGDRAQALRESRQRYALSAGSYLAGSQPNWTQGANQLMAGTMGQAFQTPMYDPFNPQATSIEALRARQKMEAALAKAQKFQDAGDTASAGMSGMNFGGK